MVVVETTFGDRVSKTIRVANRIAGEKRVL